MVVIDHGRVIARGTADELKAQVGGERLEMTLADAGQLGAVAEALRPLTHGEPRLDPQTRRLSVPVSGGVDALAEALRRLGGHSAGVLDIGLRRPDLDDVFLTLTGHAAEGAEPPGEQDESATTVSAGANR
jgi:ABC-2 type transport system ATP-binding protein